MKKKETKNGKIPLVFVTKYKPGIRHLKQKLTINTGIFLQKNENVDKEYGGISRGKKPHRFIKEINILFLANFTFVTFIKHM